MILEHTAYNSQLRKLKLRVIHPEWVFSLEEVISCKSTLTKGIGGENLVYKGNYDICTYSTSLKELNNRDLAETVAIFATSLSNGNYIALCRNSSSRIQIICFTISLYHTKMQSLDQVTERKRGQIRTFGQEAQ